MIRKQQDRDEQEVGEDQLSVGEDEGDEVEEEEKDGWWVGDVLPFCGEFSGVFERVWHDTRRGRVYTALVWGEYGPRINFKSNRSG